MPKPPIRTQWLSRPGWSSFGRVGPNGNRHAGFDYYVPRGTPIYATGNGKVTGKAFSPDKRMGFGHNLTITYDDGRKTLDAHFDQASSLNVGSRVTENTIVGYVGNTGNAWNVFWATGGRTLSHDHHQVWLNGSLVDPIGFYGAYSSAATNATPAPVTPAPDRTPLESIMAVLRIIRSSSQAGDFVQRESDGAWAFFPGTSRGNEAVLRLELYPDLKTFEGKTNDTYLNSTLTLLGCPTAQAKANPGTWYKPVPAV